MRHNLSNCDESSEAIMLGEKAKGLSSRSLCMAFTMATMLISCEPGVRHITTGVERILTNGVCHVTAGF